MIPILFEKDDRTFTTNGLGRLSDAISCKVIEERNGSYELTLVYPITGIHYEELIEDRIIFAKPNDTSQNQAFRIYSIEKPINGRVTVYAEHISYLLNVMTVKPFTAGSCAEAIGKLDDNIVVEDYNFTFLTDKQVTGKFTLEEPKTVREILGDSSGSFLDVYGTAEYEFDNFTVHMWTNRGQDNDVSIRYGKNLIDVTKTTDDQSTYAGIVPFWKGQPADSEGTDTSDIIVMLPEYVIWSGHRYDFSYPRVIPVDLSNKFDSPPSETELRTVASAYLSDNGGWIKKNEIDVDFISLWQTEEYKDIANLERVSLCDTVTVIYSDLGVSDKLKVKKTDYNVLLERYNSISLGTSRTNLVSEIVSVDDKIKNANSVQKSEYQKAIEHATQMITGGLGGYVVINRNANGQPEEILILDEESEGDIEKAVNVWRWNMGGLGHSHTGYEGPFDDVALTADGQINADRITTGNLNAVRLTAGIIRDKAGKNWWNLEDGTMQISAESFIDTEDFVTRADLQIEADRIASEVVEQVGSGIFFNCVPVDNANGTTTIQAHVFLNRNDATQTFAPYYFRWYKKTENGKEYLDYGYEITVDNSEYGYGGEIEAVFVMLEDREAITRNGKWVFNISGTYSTLAVSQGTLRFYQGYPLALSGTGGSAEAYAVFGYDYY